MKASTLLAILWLFLLLIVAALVPLAYLWTATNGPRWLTAQAITDAPVLGFTFILVFLVMLLASVMPLIVLANRSSED